MKRWFDDKEKVAAGNGHFQAAAKAASLRGGSQKEWGKVDDALKKAICKGLKESTSAAIPNRERARGFCGSNPNKAKAQESPAHKLLNSACPVLKKLLDSLECVNVVGKILPTCTNGLGGEDQLALDRLSAAKGAAIAKSTAPSL